MWNISEGEAVVQYLCLNVTVGTSPEADMLCHIPEVKEQLAWLCAGTTG